MGRCDHYPNSLSIELTPRCNLTCTHCSSHGTSELHRWHNRMKEFSAERLDRLATEVFPALTSLTLVGRGEPTMVSTRLWETLVRHVVEQRVFLSIVTNGHFLDRWLTPALLPFIETLMFSIDGITPATFAANRGGADLDALLGAVARFDAMRRSADLARRPRLAFSWTLKRNNIAEFPEFVRRVLRFEPDLVYARHLLLFFSKERDQSLVGEPHSVNRHLAEAYALLEKHGVRTDCPPLMYDPAAGGEGPSTPPGYNSAPPSRDGCMFIHRTGVLMADGEVPTCTAPFVRVAGRLDEARSFWDIWNGSTMCGVREALNTPAEWDQCRHCWYREGRYQSQRAQVDPSADSYDLTRHDVFTDEAWDFVACEQIPKTVGPR